MASAGLIDNDQAVLWGETMTDEINQFVDSPDDASDKPLAALGRALLATFTDGQLSDARNSILERVVASLGDADLADVRAAVEASVARSAGRADNVDWTIRGVFEDYVRRTAAEILEARREKIARDVRAYLDENMPVIMARTIDAAIDAELKAIRERLVARVGT